MKKRSMLAVASLAVGVVASLTAPSAHAADGQADLTGPLRSGPLASVPDALPGQVADAGAVVGQATGHVTGEAPGLVGLPV
ncbi:hypothetical protein ACFVFS_28165 [Kitasatospora sp. NPDC057692]|uniref:hypothetical protein n=1 Tax=Kitasatospora sp. NPDC057692 TaxID=3346215 RepID=UPI003686ED72